jgi:hypothetical protein
MATVLTAIGWENPEGVLQGVWTNRADIVKDFEDGSVINSGVTVNTLAGNDVLDGVASSDALVNRGRLFMGRGNDTIAVDAGDYFGILNEGLIDTGIGNDIIKGSNGGPDVRGIRNVSSGKIFAGVGDDQVIGDTSDSGGGIGIENFNDIKVGDVIEGFEKKEIAREI